MSTSVILNAVKRPHNWHTAEIIFPSLRYQQIFLVTQTDRLLVLLLCSSSAFVVSVYDVCHQSSKVQGVKLLP
jgi:hypothetical protein